MFCSCHSDTIPVFLHPHTSPSMLCLVSVPYSRTLLTTHALDQHRDTPSSLLATKIKTLLHCFSYESQYFAATQDISLDTLPGRPNRTLALRTFVIDKISEALLWSSCINEFYAHTVPSSISSVYLQRLSPFQQNSCGIF